MKKSINILFALLVIIGLGTTAGHAATWYGIYVGETRVTDENASDILGDGQFKYDAATKTLTVTNATLSNSGSLGSGISNREVDGLTIRLVGSSTFTTRMNVISSQKSFSITGTGSLKGTSATTSAFQLGGDGTTCTINGPQIEFFTESTAPTLRDYNSTYTLNLTGTSTRLSLNPLSGYAAISGLSTLSLGDGVYFTEPLYGFFSPSLKTITTDGKTAYKGHIVFSSTPASYGLSVDGVEVTTANASNIIGFGGICTFDPFTKTLNIKSGGYENTDRVSSLGIVTIRGAGIANHAVDGLNINIEGEVVMNCLYGVVSSKSVTFTGGGTLYCQYRKDENDYEKLFGQAGILLLGDGITCTINGPKLFISGTYGSGPAIYDLYQNATVSIEGTSSLLDLTPGYGFAAIEGLGELRIGSGLAINKPTGGRFNTTLKSITADGSTAYEGNVSISASEEYGILVAETKVTSANAADILGDGQFSYDAESKTLTVTDAMLYNNGTIGNGITNREVDGLTIRLVGNSTFSTRMSVISSEKDFNIAGSGSLKGISSNFNGLYFSSDRVRCDIQDVTLHLTGFQNGLRDYKQNGFLIVSGTNTSITLANSSPDYPTIDGLFQMQLDDGIYISEPQGGWFDNTLKSITTDGSTAYGGTVVISSAEPSIECYGLTVAGIDVNEQNAGDILGDGTLRYDPDRRMLTMENAALTLTETSGIVNDEVEDLTICVNGKNSITVDGNASDNTVGIITHQPTTITGYGILDITSRGRSCGMSSTAPVTIDGPRLYCRSEMIAWLGGLLSADGELTVRGAYTQLTLTSGDEYTPLFKFKSLNLGDGLYVTLPYGGYYDTDHGYLTTDGETNYKGTLVISDAPAQTPPIAGDVNGDGIVDISDIARLIHCIAAKADM